MKHKKYALIILLMIILITSAFFLWKRYAQESFNQELNMLFEQDQSDRLQSFPPQGTPEYERVWEQITEHDKQRRKRALEIIQSNTNLSCKDYWHIAMIFQHGEELDDFEQAHTFAKKSMDMGCEEAKWLVAASYDRWLKKQGKPQKYGTQFTVINDVITQWETDPSTTDEERALYNVPSNEEQLRQIQEYMKTTAPKKSQEK